MRIISAYSVVKSVDGEKKSGRRLTYLGFGCRFAGGCPGDVRSVSICSGTYIVSAKGLIGLGRNGLSGTGRLFIGGLCARSGLIFPGDPATYIDGIIISLSLVSSKGGLLDRYDSVSAADRSENPGCSEYRRGAAPLKSNCGIFGG